MILIIGRSGSGKDHLARELSKHGLKQVLSYTTRPPRRPDEDTHIFIKPEESCNYKDKIATTEIAGCEYFATKLSDFEAVLRDKSELARFKAGHPNISDVIVSHNDYRPETAKALASRLINNCACRTA